MLIGGRSSHSGGMRKRMGIVPSWNECRVIARPGDPSRRRSGIVVRGPGDLGLDRVAVRLRRVEKEVLQDVDRHRETAVGLVVMIVVVGGCVYLDDDPTRVGQGHGRV